MDTQPRGWRTTPPALLVGLALPAVYGLVRLIIQLGFPPERGFTPRLIFIGEGIGFASVLLVLLGMLELSRRLTGRAALGAKVAVAGLAIVLAVDTAFGLAQFKENIWESRWIFEAYNYLASTAWLLFPIGLAFVVDPKHRVLAVIAAVFCVLSWPPEFLRDPLFGWIKLEGKQAWTLESALRLVRYSLLIALAILASRGTTTLDRYAASGGLRLASRGLWLRVIAAVAVVLLTLMMIGSKGGEGGVALLKMAMMAQGLVGFLALLLVGLGAARAARASVPELGAWPLILGGGASLWAAGVTLAQLPYLYRMLYGDRGGGFSRGDNMEWATALSLALPLVVIVGVGMLATAISGYGARRGDDALRADAQAKGVGFVALMLTAVAIQNWMLPEARSIGTFAMMSLIAAVAGLWGTVMMAKLLDRGAIAIEEEPGLPPASIVNADS